MEKKKLGMEKKNVFFFFIPLSNGLCVRCEELNLPQIMITSAVHWAKKV